jgi:hypothetical protein
VKSCAWYIAELKRRYGDDRMSDRQLGENLGGYSQQMIAKAKAGNMSDPLAVRVAEVLGLDPGELLLVARSERERDPTIAAHLRAYAVKTLALLAESTAPSGAGGAWRKRSETIFARGPSGPFFILAPRW